MKEIMELIHELRCDINYYKVGGKNDTEIKNAEKTLIKLQELVQNSMKPFCTFDVETQVYCSRRCEFCDMQLKKTNDEKEL